jgi:RNA polymerase sigma-70 factor (ECF subfamily)
MERPLAERFEAHRPHLRTVAQRILGSGPDAEDAVQEAWLRLADADAAAIDNLGGWLTTVVARICLDHLRTPAARRTRPAADVERPPPAHGGDADDDPEATAVIADAIGHALLVVLDALTPAERVAFVLHDVFAVPFEDIAPIVARTPEATRQLASRARRRVQQTDEERAADRTRHRQVVDAFLAASRGGDFDGLLAVLDPDVVLRADDAGVRMGSAASTRGARAVAETFAGRAKGAEPAIVDGGAALVWAVGGQIKVVFALAIEDDRIIAVDLVADETTLDVMDVQLPG